MFDRFIPKKNGEKTIRPIGKNDDSIANLPSFNVIEVWLLDTLPHISLAAAPSEHACAPHAWRTSKGVNRASRTSHGG